MLQAFPEAWWSPVHRGSFDVPSPGAMLDQEGSYTYHRAQCSSERLIPQSQLGLTDQSLGHS
jgi:hypothetical protein